MIKLFLSAYENGTWQDATLDWLEDRQDGAIEVLVTAGNRQTLGIEHTLIQPFTGEKQDADRFLQAFRRMEGDASLILDEQHLDVGIPVGALPGGYDWNAIGHEVRAHLAERRRSLPEGTSRVECVVGLSSKKARFTIPIRVSLTMMPGMGGACRVGRCDAPDDLGSVVERALETKLQKLVAAPVDHRLLLLERDRLFPGFLEIYAQIERLAGLFPGLERIDAIWFANTAGLETSRFVTFELIDQRGLVELLNFQDGGTMPYNQPPRSAAMQADRHPRNISPSSMPTSVGPS